MPEPARRRINQRVLSPVGGAVRFLARAVRKRHEREARIARIARGTEALQEELRSVDRRLDKLTKAVRKPRRGAESGRPPADEKGAGRLDYQPTEIYLRTASRLERSKRLHACAKEPWTVRWIEEWLETGETLYDVGANVGAYSLIAAKRRGGASRVVALEPGYATFASLCENVVLNEAGQSVIPLPVALSSRTELSTLSYRDLRPGGSKHTVGDEGPREEGAASLYRQPLLVWSLDDLLERFDLPRPDHLKIDVDGGELAVIAGASTTLANGHVKSLMLEMDEAQADRLTAALGELGFALRERFARPDAQPGAPSYALFTPAR